LVRLNLFKSQAYHHCGILRENSVASEDFSMRQREDLGMKTRSASVQGSNSDETLVGADENRRGSRASIAALQAQLAQITQAHSGASTSTPPVAVVGEQYLIFSLLDREFAIKAEYIQGVERLADVTPVPNVAAWIRGVINLRGSIASVVDLRAFLDMEQLTYNPRTRLLSVQFNEMVICLVVDGVSEMVPLPAHVISSINVRQSGVPQWAIPYVEGSAMLNNRFMVILDAARLLFSEKMQRYEALD
jgi:purine-binding chemotaxis protein CheW